MDITEIPALISAIQGRLSGLEAQVADLKSAARASAPPLLAGGGDADRLVALQEECEGLRRQLQEAHSIRERLETELQTLQQQAAGSAAGDAAPAGLQASLREMEQRLEEANLNWQKWYEECGAEKNKADEALARLQAAEEEIAALRAEAEDARKESASISESLESARQQLDAAKADASGNNALLERFWPSCLNAEVLRPFHAQWREELSRPGASPSLLCMFANIFSWSCYRELQRSKGSTDTELDRPEYAALHAFSRYFLDWLYEIGKDSDGAASISRELALSINSVLQTDNAKYTIEVDEIDLGDTFDAAFMQAVPQGNSTGHVKQLHSWAIVPSAGSGICLAKAMVLL